MPFKPLLRWLPALLIMGVIFAFSSTPSDTLPSYGLWDTLVKKSGHALSYGLLASAFWFGLNGGGSRGAATSSPGGMLRPYCRPYMIAWIFAVLYAITDEFHQSFTPGRRPSLLDVLVFDAGGAALALFILYWFRTRKHDSTLPA